MFAENKIFIPKKLTFRKYCHLTETVITKEVKNLCCVDKGDTISASDGNMSQQQDRSDSQHFYNNRYNMRHPEAVESVSKLEFQHSKSC